MNRGWTLGWGAVATMALASMASAQAGLERINGRVQAVSAEQIVLVTENGTTFIKMTPQATVSVVRPGQADGRPADGDAAAEGAPGKLSDVELGSVASVTVTRTGDGLPVASRIVVEADH